MRQSLLAGLMVQLKGHSNIGRYVKQQNIAESSSWIKLHYQDISQPVLCKSGKVKLSGLLKIYISKYVRKNQFIF